MAMLWRLVMLTAGFLCLCLERDLVNANEALEEINTRLSTIEANQESMREGFRFLETHQSQDIQMATNSCQSMESMLEAQKEVIISIRQRLQDNIDCKNKSQPNSDNSGPCHASNHTILDDDWRAIAGEYHGYDDKCDKRIQPGWYRFRLHGQSGHIPTSCVPENNCQTDAPTWLDLQGQSLPAAGQQIDARACSHWDNDCCNWEKSITVRNCGNFFVYKIQPLVTCDLAFCVEPDN